MALASASAVAVAVAIGAAVERGESHAQRRPTPPPRTTPTAAAPPARPSPSLTVLTFNAGLAVGVLPLARERVAVVTDELARQPADVVCAQEVWLDEHWRGLASRVAGRLPHTHRAAAAPRAADEACSAADIAPLEACHRASCVQAPPDQLASCMIGRCAHLVGSIGAGCVSCLLREPWTSIGAVRAACAADLPPIARAPAGRAAPTFAFGGSSGIGILSRLPLAETDTLPLRSSWSRREVLYARVAASDVGPLHLFCTHLSAQLGAVAPSGGRTWAQEHAEQVRDLLAFVERKAARAPGAVVLAGDLNTGPALGGRATAQLPLHYARFEAAGFDSPYAAQGDARCTYCFDNPLIGRRAGGILIDHVLVRGFAGTARGARVLDRPSAITVDGATRATPPSDHYGVSLTLSPASSADAAASTGAASSPR